MSLFAVVGVLVTVFVVVIVSVAVVEFAVAIAVAVAVVAVSAGPFENPIGDTKDFLSEVLLFPPLSPFVEDIALVVVAADADAAVL